MLVLSGCSRQAFDFSGKIENLPEKGDYKISTLNQNGSQYKQLLSGDAGKYGGTLVLALSGSGPKTFNIWAAADSTSSSASALMFSGLVERNPWNGEIIPHLAESYAASNGGKTITVNLRRGLKWSDGEPITSKDVLFTWNTILKGGFERLGARESVLVEGEFPEVKALDDYTVSFTAKRTFAPLLGELSYPIAPAHYFEKKLSKVKPTEQKQFFSTIWSASADINDIVVSGPFKLKTYRVGERIEYEANPHFFVVDKAGRRLPYLKKLIYAIIPSNDLELFKFAAGEIPIIGLDTETLPLISKLSVKKPYTIYNAGPSDASSFVVFNMSRRGNVPKHLQEWFNNRNFRRALEYALERQTIIDSVFQGVGSPLCFSFNPKSIYFNKSLQPQCRNKADLEKAEELLKKEGFRKDKNGQLIDSKGKLVKFTLYTNAGSATDTNSPRELMAILIKEQWAKLGIKIDVKVIEFNNLVVRVMQTGDWQAVLMGLTGGDPFEPNSSANVFYSNSRLHIFDQRPAGEKATDIRPWEAEIDKALAEGAAKLEFTERKPYYDKVQQILWDESPMIYLVTPQTLLAAQEKNIGNFRPSKLSGATYNVEQWYLKN